MDFQWKSFGSSACQDSTPRHQASSQDTACVVSGKVARPTRTTGSWKLPIVWQGPQWVWSPGIATSRVFYIILESTIGPMNTRLIGRVMGLVTYNRATYCQLNLTRKIVHGERCTLPANVGPNENFDAVLRVLFYCRVQLYFPLHIQPVESPDSRTFSLNRTDQGSTKGTEFVGLQGFVFSVFSIGCNSMWSTRKRRSFLHPSSWMKERGNEDEVQFFIQV